MFSTIYNIIFILTVQFLLFQDITSTAPSSTSSSNVESMTLQLNKVKMEYNENILFHELKIVAYDNSQYLLLEPLNYEIFRTNPIYYISKTPFNPQTLEKAKESEWSTANNRSTAMGIIIPKENIKNGDMLYIAVACEKCQYSFVMKLFKEENQHLPRHMYLQDM